MEIIKKIFKWIWDNKEWVFSGIGASILILFITMYIDNKEDAIDTKDTFDDKGGIEVSGIVNGDIYQNSIINNFSVENNNKSEAKISDDFLQDGNNTRETQWKRELVISVDGDVIYPISIDIKDEQKVGDWIYFRYRLEETNGDDTIVYPALFRYKEDVCIAERVNERACYSFEVVDDCVYYLDSTTYSQDHGELYVARPDGKNERLLEEELYEFQIVDEKYIYYVYRHDTVGAGIEGHALHRMNLDGSDIMIAAYEVSGVDFGISHFGYKVVDGWVDCGTFKIELGEPADGYEKVVFNDIGDNDWVYYVTNRLMKARKDGSERVELDDADDYWYEIEKIEDDWIHYYKGGEKYKIQTDGTGKELIINE